MFSRREGLLLKSLYERITELEREVDRLEQWVRAYRDMDRDRTATEFSILAVGILIGVALGYYAAREFL
jgi:hypothetical protein